MTNSFVRVVKSTLLTTGLLVLCCQAQAASYYVDYAGGSDSNNGAATGSAWKHCPGDSAATGNPASASLNPGDTVFFKGGVTYVFVNPTNGSAPGITVTSGAAGNPITYDGNSAGNWGTGMAVLTDNHASPNGCAAFASAGAMSYVTFNDFAVGPLGGAATLPADPNGTLYAPNGIKANPGSGVSAQGYMTGVVVSGCTFSNLGFYGSTFPLGNASLAGLAIYARGCNGLTVTNCSISQAREGIFIDNPLCIANLSIAGCTISQIEEWGITLPTGINSYLSNVYIFNSVFTNVDQNYASWTGYGGAPHRDTIFSFGAEGCNGNCSVDRNVTDTNVCIYNNVFVDTLGEPGGSTVIWFQDNASVNIYNNIFWNTQQVNGAVQLSGPSANSQWRATVFNNTFYESDYSVSLCFGANPFNNFQWPISASNKSKLLTIENNIVYEWSGATPYNNCFDMILQSSSTSISNNVVMDYNLYRTPQTYKGYQVYGNGPELGGYLMLPLLETFGWDNHSIFVNPVFVNPTAGDFHLAQSSPVLTNGVNLSSLSTVLPGLLYDKDGNRRPATGSWAMGAYQLPASTTNAALPVVQGLRVVSYY